MTLQELFNQALLDTGQFLLGTADIEMNEDNFLRLVRNCLNYYNAWEPVEDRFNLQMSGTFYTFFGSDYYTGNSRTAIPRFITEIIPVVIAGFPWYFQNWMTWQGKGFGDEFNPLSAMWRYKKPMLVTEYTGTFTIWALYNHAIVQEGAINTVSINNSGSGYLVNDILTVAPIGNTSPSGGSIRVLSVGGNGGILTASVETPGISYQVMNSVPLTGGHGFGSSINVLTLDPLTTFWDLPDISYDDFRFLKLVKGRLMEGLGRSRRSFILNDVPITMDAGNMVTDGQEVAKEAMQQMQDQKWYTAQT